MPESVETREVTLRQSSWELLDEAASLSDGTVDEIVDSVIRGFLATDDGQTLERAECLSRLRAHFGNNRG